MAKLKCQRCGYEWEYKGKSKWYCSCPRCKTTVKVKKGYGRQKDARSTT